MARVVLRQVTKQFQGPRSAPKGGQTTIGPLDLVIENNQLTVLVGPSGCGKSTLLRMIAGLETPTTGQIEIDERLVNEVAPFQRGVAMVFQSYALYPHLTVRENLRFGLTSLGVSKGEMERRISWAAEVLALENYLDRKPKHLSGGQRQRVAMGRAIVRQPKVFLFDEPLSNLDAALRTRMRVEIAKLRAGLGATAVYVTHDQVEAMTLAHKIVVMQAGRIEQEGSPLDVYHHPKNKFVASFLGSPAMNFVDILHFRSKVSLPERLQPKSEDDSLGIELGIRPEHLSIGDSERFAGQLNGTVYAVEHLGDQQLVHLELVSPSRTSRIVARLPGDVEVRGDQMLTLGFDPGRCHWFDRSGNTVRASVGCQSIGIAWSEFGNFWSHRSRSPFRQTVLFRRRPGKSSRKKQDTTPFG
jgi:multiple sugar transport system ATP-binding protein